MEKCIKNLLDSLKVECSEELIKSQNFWYTCAKLNEKMFSDILKNHTWAFKSVVTDWLTVLKAACTLHPNFTAKMAKTLLNYTMRYTFSSKIDIKSWFIKSVVSIIFDLTKNKHLLLKYFFKCLWSYKNFDVQRTIIDIIVRKYNYNNNQSLLKTYIPKKELQALFRNIELNNNYASIRKFLNCFNSYVKPIQIFSVKVMKIQLDDFIIAENAWVDVNTPVNTISFLCKRSSFSRKKVVEQEEDEEDIDEVYENVNFRLSQISRMNFEDGIPNNPDRLIFKLSHPCSAYFDKTSKFLSKYKNITFYITEEKDRFHDFLCQYLLETLKGSLDVRGNSDFVFDLESDRNVFNMPENLLKLSQEEVNESFFSGDETILICDDDNEDNDEISDSQEETHIHISKINRTPKPRKNNLDISLNTSFPTTNGSYNRTRNSFVISESVSATQVDDSGIVKESCNLSPAKAATCTNLTPNLQSEEIIEMYDFVPFLENIQREEIVPSSQNLDEDVSSTIVTKNKKKRKRKKCCKEDGNAELPKESFFNNVDSETETICTRTRTVRRPQYFSDSCQEEPTTKRKKSVENNSAPESKRRKVVLPVKESENNAPDKQTIPLNNISQDNCLRKPNCLKVSLPVIISENNSSNKQTNSSNDASQNCRVSEPKRLKVVPIKESENNSTNKKTRSSNNINQDDCSSKPKCLTADLPLPISENNSSEKQTSSSNVASQNSCLSEPKRLKVVLPLKRFVNNLANNQTNSSNNINQPKEKITDVDVAFEMQQRCSLNTNSTQSDEVQIISLPGKRKNKTASKNKKINKNQTKNRSCVKSDKTNNNIMDTFDRLKFGLPMTQCSGSLNRNINFFSSSSSSDSPEILNKNNESNEILIQNKENEQPSLKKTVKPVKQNKKSTNAKPKKNQKKKTVENVSSTLNLDVNDNCNNENNTNESVTVNQPFNYCKECQSIRQEEIESFLKKICQECLSPTLPTAVKRNVCNKVINYLTELKDSFT